MAAPILTPPPQQDSQQEQLTLSTHENMVPIRVGVPHFSTRTLLVRSLPMVGLGCVLAASVYSPPSIAGGIAMIVIEVALGALAIAVWFPRKHKNP